MIYFEQKVQEELIGRFARVLNPRGYLMLGHSESLHRISTSFEAVGKTVFRLLEQDGHPAKMSKNPWKEESVPKVPIIAGQLIATRESTWLTTVLGSCVAVCIYDPKAQVGGMNHFVLPTGEGSEKNCYGIHAMANLIRKVQEMGGGLRTLRSKAFGGAQTGESIGDVGRQNIDFTREYLTDAGIPIIAEKLGGNQGMHIMFNPTTGQAFVKSC